MLIFWSSFFIMTRILPSRRYDRHSGFPLQRWISFPGQIFFVFLFFLFAQVQGLPYRDIFSPGRTLAYRPASAKGIWRNHYMAGQSWLGKISPSPGAMTTRGESQPTYRTSFQLPFLSRTWKTWFNSRALESGSSRERSGLRVISRSCYMIYATWGSRSESTGRD